jgi:hypothetical protein
MSKVKHPTHYNEHPSGVECIEIVQHMTFNVGNVVKYCWRAGLKDYQESEELSALLDLKKAREYLEFEIARLEGADIEGTLEVDDDFFDGDDDDDTIIIRASNFRDGEEWGLDKEAVYRVRGIHPSDFNPSAEVGEAVAGSDLDDAVDYSSGEAYIFCKDDDGTMITELEKL